MRVTRLDHRALTVTDVDAAVRFYTEALGMAEETSGGGRKALRFGRSKINLRQVGNEFGPKPHRAAPGNADLRLIVEDPIDAVMAELAASGVPIVAGPVERTGARGPIVSVYLRDPDDNLVELSRYAKVPRCPGRLKTAGLRFYTCCAP